MGLSDKVAELERGASHALTVAQWWKTQIATRGEQTAESFYKHLGLNHLETKSVEWEGLSLSREPNEVEKICVKGIAQAQESGKAQLTSILLDARTSLIESALSAIKKLTPATYHKLILTMPDKFHDELKDHLSIVFKAGRELVARELLAQQRKSAWAVFVFTKQDEDDELDDIVDLTDARMANELQARISAAASRYALLGRTGPALWNAVQEEVGSGSTGWLDRIATGATNKVLNFGRAREAENRKDEWGRVEYSALLDSNVCDPCAADDGQSAASESDLTPTPNPDCAGSDWCRCFHVFVMDTAA